MCNEPEYVNLLILDLERKVEEARETKKGYTILNHITIEHDDVKGIIEILRYHLSKLTHTN